MASIARGDQRASLAASRQGATRIRFNTIDETWVDKVVNGAWTNIAANAVAGGDGTMAVKYATGPNRIVVYQNGTQLLSVNDSSITSGGVALGGDTAKFDNLKVGYDNNSENETDGRGSISAGLLSLTDKIPGN